MPISIVSVQRRIVLSGWLRNSETEHKDRVTLYPFRMVIGNILDETAYHEAGHMTIAARVSLDLQQKGIVIYEVGNVTDGWAFYWEDNQQWKDILTALRAGHIAQQKKFPGSYSLGAEIDFKKFSYIVEQHFPGVVHSNMEEETKKKASDLLNTHWSAVEDVARGVIAADWLPVAPGEHERATRMKRLDGNAVAAILASHNFQARVR